MQQQRRRAALAAMAPADGAVVLKRREGAQLSCCCAAQAAAGGGRDWLFLGGPGATLSDAETRPLCAAAKPSGGSQTPLPEAKFDVKARRPAHHLRPRSLLLHASSSVSSPVTARRRCLGPPPSLSLFRRCPRHALIAPRPPSPCQHILDPRPSSPITTLARIIPRLLPRHAVSRPSHDASPPRLATRLHEISCCLLRTAPP